MSEHTKPRGIARTLIDNSFLLIAGAVAALIWANVAHQTGSTSYSDFVGFDVASLWADHATEGHGAQGHGVEGVASRGMGQALPLSASHRRPVQRPCSSPRMRRPLGANTMHPTSTLDITA